MIAPLLHGAEGLAAAPLGKVDQVLIDRLNDSHANRIYREVNAVGMRRGCMR